ncbi:PadR family transcriptional regulator [Streptomyces sp. A1136]|uniref:PadR family transcriptional regulator n=1 Tax=Streptomyces sp. A1136 TaxID=2563102 RepID=UPI0019CFACC2|nr:PadR family transcriptional regulator [Streptomyces sp. A1136]
MDRPAVDRRRVRAPAARSPPPGEPKRLEEAGYASSRRVGQEEGARDKRAYRIIDAGSAAVRRWAREAPVDPPVLKHGPMPRLCPGHLLEPERMCEVRCEQREFAEEMRRHAEADAAAAGSAEGLGVSHAHPQVGERYYACERDLAAAMLDDIEALAAARGPGDGG